MTEDATVKLARPVTADGEEVAELRMRRPKARDSRDAQKGGGVPAEIEIGLFANLCMVSPGVVEELDMADYVRLQDAYQGFLQG